MTSSEQGIKLYVSADMEGVCGVHTARQVNPHNLEDQLLYQEAIELMAREIATLIAPALEDERVTQIVVNDSHARMDNLRLDILPDKSAHPKLRLLCGKPKPIAMMAGLDGSYDAAFLLGYHARAGTEKGLLCHSFHDAIARIHINGVEVGEAGMNTAYAWLQHKVPVVVAAGDDALCREVKQFMPAVKTVMTKESLGFNSTLHRPVELVLDELEEVMEAFLRQSQEASQQFKNAYHLPEALRQPPYELTIQFIQPLYTDIVAILPGLKRLNGTTVQTTSRDIKTCYLWLQSIYSMLMYEKSM